MEAAKLRPEDCAQAAEKGGAMARGAFVEFGGEGAGRAEGGGTAAKEAGEDESGEETDGVVCVFCLGRGGCLVEVRDLQGDIQRRALLPRWPVL